MALLGVAVEHLGRGRLAPRFPESDGLRDEQEPAVHGRTVPFAHFPRGNRRVRRQCETHVPAWCDARDGSFSEEKRREEKRKTPRRLALRGSSEVKEDVLFPDHVYVLRHGGVPEREGLPPPARVSSCTNSHLGLASRSPSGGKTIESSHARGRLQKTLDRTPLESPDDTRPPTHKKCAHEKNPESQRLSAGAGEGGERHERLDDRVARVLGRPEFGAASRALRRERRRIRPIILMTRGISAGSCSSVEDRWCVGLRAPRGPRASRKDPYHILGAHPDLLDSRASRISNGISISGVIKTRFSRKRGAEFSDGASSSSTTFTSGKSLRREGGTKKKSRLRGATTRARLQVLVLSPGVSHKESKLVENAPLFSCDVASLEAAAASAAQTTRCFRVSSSSPASPHLPPTTAESIRNISTPFSKECLRRV